MMMYVSFVSSTAKYNNMKHNLIAIICLLAATTLYAQEKEWKQMEDFHGIISKTYHPAEEGNLQPVKDKADSLVLRAIAWQASAVPAGYNAKTVKPKLDKLIIECKAVKTAITQKKNDETLKKLITAVHTTFHGIMEKGEQ